MNLIRKTNTNANDWASLKQFTSARIALGKTGVSIPLKECLDLRLAHAQAKDAVYSLLDKMLLTQALTDAKIPVLCVCSKASERDVYLQRPDLGRTLSGPSEDNLQMNAGDSPPDIVIVIADGLSAAAVNKQAATAAILLSEKAKEAGFSIAPVILAEQARVAIADEIGQLLKAKLSIILIGERPGLSSFESMSAYITYQPKTGTTDESRNCISNIKEGGLTTSIAAAKIMELVKAAFLTQATGVALKDQSSSVFISALGEEHLYL